MNIHKNARLTLIRRMELVKDILERRLTLCAAAYGEPGEGFGGYQGPAQGQSAGASGGMILIAMSHPGLASATGCT